MNNQLLPMFRHKTCRLVPSPAPSRWRGLSVRCEELHRQATQGHVTSPFVSAERACYPHALKLAHRVNRGCAACEMDG